MWRPAHRPRFRIENRNAIFAATGKHLRKMPVDAALKLPV
jgi:hypothetical protein